MTQRLIGELVMRRVEDLLHRDQKIYKDTETPVSNPDMYVGLELEIENWGGGTSFPGFTVHTDNSLRNNGLEWITMPTKLRHVENLITGFFRKFNIKEEVNYSERCSTHVHVNVQDHTPDQLITLVLLYQLFERLLFNFVHEDRKSNIFCVPWYQAGVTYELVERIEKWDQFHLHQWQKYTALNLLTIEQKGTVEYRHLEGTCDVKRIMTWCNMLGSMHAYAKANDLAKVKETIINLNTSSAYDVFLQSVFGQWMGNLMVKDYIIAMEEGVLDCKYMLSQPIKKEKPKLDLTGLRRPGLLVNFEPDEQVQDHTEEFRFPPRTINPRPAAAPRNATGLVGTSDQERAAARAGMSVTAYLELLNQARQAPARRNNNI